jgi:Spy/CpxP family protein refolding chaperone
LTLSDSRPLLALLLAAAVLAPSPSRAQAPGDAPPPVPDPAQERIERRIRMARSLGLAEALELDEAATARLNAAMAPYDARRKALLDAIRGDLRTLRQAARRGDPKALAGVEAAVQRIFDARQAALSIDREMFAAVSKGMPPEQVARMALFFARFRQRFGMEVPEPPGGRPQ